MRRCGSAHHQAVTTTEIRLDKRCDSEAVTAKFDPSRSGASPAFEFISHHAGTTTNIAFRHRPEAALFRAASA